jgi:triacylglycerol lipase
MTASRLVCLLALAACASAAGAAPAPDARVVVLLHGLARSADSMRPLARALEAEGYRVCNVAYPSREHPIAALAADHVVPALARCAPDPATPLDFVTHSLGGIIVRQLAADGAVKAFGRVVMLSPPNHGSEVVDEIGDWMLFDAINGPAGQELGTAADALPKRLGPARFAVGIVAGDRSVNPTLSKMIPGADDGKVSVESAKLEGMLDFIVVPASHTFIMKDPETIRQTLHFLAHGKFVHAGPGG